MDRKDQAAFRFPYIVREAEERPIYDDINYFTRGRSGFRPEPPADTNAKLVAIGIGVLGALVSASALFGLIHMLLPSVN